MAEAATTTTASRTFQDGVKISWTPSATDNTVKVDISIAGAGVYDETFQGDDNENVDESGDGYSIKGKLSTTWDADGTHGKLEGDLTWDVRGSEHGYKGLIGNW